MALSACAEPVGRATAAVIGGGLASGPEYDAVLCMPRYGNAAEPGIEAGWDQPVFRCEESMALVTPNVAMGTRSRLIEQTHPFELGGRTRSDGQAADRIASRTALELGVTEDVTRGPEILRRATGCLEIRRSGLAPCCNHVRAVDPSVATPSEFTPAQRIYIPPSELWDVPFSDPAHGVDVVTGPPTYRQYLEGCVAPMAPDDEVVSEVVFFVLSERIAESDVTPFPLALEYPDGSVSPQWLESSMALGDLVGFGDGEPGRTLLGFMQGIRRVATAATALRPAPPLRDPGDPGSLNTDVWRFTADGGQFRVETSLLGDGLHPVETGAAHMDFAAPWLYASGGVRRVYAAHLSADGGSFPADVEYATHLTPDTAGFLREYFDPDGDGLLRGSSFGARPDYVDRDGDGLAEYRVVAGTPGSSGCVEAVPPIPGSCWLPTHDDNCPPPPHDPSPMSYANPRQLDIDGDGVGAPCDVCAEVWDPDQATCVAVGDHRAGDREVFDGDVIGAACAFARHVNRDTDGDGVPEWCDNCPSTPNPLQEDLDTDGLGDACEIDSDLDFIIDDLDGCPYTWDPAQEVCALDVSQPHPLNGRPMGVACAPTPCASIDPSTTSSTDARGFASEVRNDLVEGTGFVTHLAEVEVRVRPGCRVLRHEPTREGTGLVRTGMRWCPCDGVRTDSVAARERCEDTFECTRVATAYTVPAAPADRRWRSMTVDFERPPPILSPRGDEAVILYEPSPHLVVTGRPLTAGCTAEDLREPPVAVTSPIRFRGRWDYAGDAAREHAALIADLTACDPTCPGTCNALGLCDPGGARPAPYLTDRVNPFSSESLVRAVGWAHSVRYERCDEEPCAGAGGMVPAGGPLDSLGAGSDEASHYWSGETVARTFTSGREPDFVPFFPFVIPFPEICWFCADAFPELWLSHRACGPSGCAAQWVARAEGADVPVNDQLTIGAHVALTQLELSWVLPRELKEHLARDAVLGVGLDAQAQVIAQLAITDAGTLGLAEEKGDPLPLPQNPNVIAPADVVFPQLASDGCRMDAPRARAGALFLLGNLRVLVAVGGEGAGSDHVTFTHLDTGRVHSIPLRGERPGPVLAAAMHVTRMEALVLDEHEVRPRGRGARGRGARFARFLLVDLRSGESRELLRFPRAAAFDRYHLVGLADGRYALVATHERSERTWVFALAASPDDLALTGWRRLRGVPVGAPVSSVRGLSLPFLARGARTWAPVGVRAPDFAPCRQDDLRSVL